MDNCEDGHHRGQMNGSLAASTIYKDKSVRIAQKERERKTKIDRQGRQTDGWHDGHVTWVT